MSPGDDLRMMAPVRIERLNDGSVDVLTRSLLNLVIVCDDGRAGRIVEVEAYEGEGDPASHAWKGLRQHNATLFGRAGLLYVYRSYGIHWCMNVVLGVEGEASAALIRALEPLAGWAMIAEARPGVRREVDYSNGPGKVGAALGIDGSHDGTDLLDRSSPVRLVDDGTPSPSEPVITTRVGISRAVDRPWRFVVPDSPWVSRGRPAGG